MKKNFFIIIPLIILASCELATFKNRNEPVADEDIADEDSVGEDVDLEENIQTILNANEYPGQIIIISLADQNYHGIGDTVSYKDFGPTVKDEEGLPITIWRDDPYNNPVSLGGWGLSALNQYYLNTYNKDKFLTYAQQCAQRLDEIAFEQNESLFYPYYFYFWMIDQFTPSWYSGMAQGRALNLLSMLYEITGRKQYLEAADHTFDSILSLQTLNDDPWISTIDENNYFWIEEYPTDEPAHVLNGFIFALYGIYEYWIQTESELAEILLNRSIKTLKDHLDLYRRPGEVCQATIIFTVNDNYFYRLKLLKNTSKIKEQILNYFRFFRFSFLAASSIL